MFNKKGGLEAPMIAFILFFIALIILAPIALKVINSVITPLGTNLAAMSPAANQSAAAVVATSNAFWDFAIIFAFVGMMIVMFISSYFIDVHPIFIVIYIMLAFILFLIIPSMQDAFGQIYGLPEFSSEVDNLSMTNFLQKNFGIVTLGIYIITGIIMFAKMRSRQEQ